MLMNVVTSACAVCGVSFLFLAIGNVHGQTQSAPAPAPSQDAAKPSAKQPAEQALSPKELAADQGQPPRALPPRERAWQILHDGLQLDNAEKRAKAVAALGLLKSNAEAEKLATAALKDDKSDVRAAAATALGSMHAVGAKGALEAALDDNEPAVVLAAANSLLLLKDTNFAYDVYYGVLTGTMRTHKGVIREQIKDQLKTLHDKKKVAELGLEQGVGFIPYGGLGYGMVKTLVKNDNSPVRAAAARKLAHDPDPVSANALVDATQDKNWVVRQAALEAIAERGDRALIPKIVPALDDDKDEVRFTGAACVARLSAMPGKRRVPASSVASVGSQN